MKIPFRLIFVTRFQLEAGWNTKCKRYQPDWIHGFLCCLGKRIIFNLSGVLINSCTVNWNRTNWTEMQQRKATNIHWQSLIFKYLPIIIGVPSVLKWLASSLPCKASSEPWLGKKYNKRFVILTMLDFPIIHYTH